MGKLFAIGITLGLFIYFPLIEEGKDKIGSLSTTETVKDFKIADPDSLNEAQFFPAINQDKYEVIFNNHPEYHSDGFDYPVGKPDATNYYKALNFGQRFHLGEDWNGTGGGNTDLGDPVYAAAHGLVVYADDICCGWGNTVRIIHYLSEHNKYIETVYTHLQNIHVKTGDLIQRGEQLGTIGNARGKYVAHLHFELRDFVSMSMGPGYSKDQFGYLNPTDFINANRPQ